MLNLGEWKCRLKGLELGTIPGPKGLIRERQIAQAKAEVKAREAIAFNLAGGRHSHYGIHIKILEMGKLRCLTAEVKADHKADVHVEIGREIREFTFDEFLILLGFMNPKS